MASPRICGASSGYVVPPDADPSEQPWDVPTLPGCGCVWISRAAVDTTECAVHPLTCDAVHPETGIGCHHDPGHTGACHAYVLNVSWPNEYARENVSD